MLCRHKDDLVLVPRQQTRVYDPEAGIHNRYAELCSCRASLIFKTNSVQEMQSLQALNIAWIDNNTWKIILLEREEERKWLFLLQSLWVFWLLLSCMRSVPPAWFSSLKEFGNWQKLEKITSGRGCGSLYLLISKIIPISSLTLPVAKSQPQRYGHCPWDIEPMMHLLPMCKRSFVCNPGRRRGGFCIFSAWSNEFVMWFFSPNH